MWSWKVASGRRPGDADGGGVVPANGSRLPVGGGDYEVATVNLGRSAGVTVASALLVDYILTVAVSISSASQYAAAAVPGVAGHEVLIASVMVIVLAAMNLRGVRESGTFFAVPTYLFMAAILGMCGYGLLQLLNGTLPDVASAELQLIPAGGLGAAADHDRAAPAAGSRVLLGLCRPDRCGGDQQRGAGVPQAQEPQCRHDAAPARTDRGDDDGQRHRAGPPDGSALCRPAPPRSLRTPEGEPLPAGYTQDTVIAQLARAIFDHFPPGFYFVVVVTGIILVLAANTAFNGFPVLGSILAKDGLGTAGARHAR